MWVSNNLFLRKRADPMLIWGSREHNGREELSMNGARHFDPVPLFLRGVQSQEATGSSTRTRFRNQREPGRSGRKKRIMGHRYIFSLRAVKKISTNLVCSSICKN
jgi:hypothetical protein|nr:MAG: hypothetical protein CVU57_29165 [Deltaproteobacteria bacterium HGW-Deltaproteobacteria-15]